jgi:hypothetical protein
VTEVRYIPAQKIKPLLTWLRISSADIHMYNF